MERLATVVLEPRDVRGRCFLNFLILRANLDGVGSLIDDRTGFRTDDLLIALAVLHVLADLICTDGIGIDDLTASSLNLGSRVQDDGAFLVRLVDVLKPFVRSVDLLLGILLEHGDVAARIHRRQGLNVNIVIVCVAPLLHNPVLEDIAFRRRHGSRSGRLRIVDVQIAIGWSSVAAGNSRILRRVGQAIHNADAVCTIDGRTPLGIQIEFLGNPEAVNIGVVRCTVAPLIHRVGEMRGLVVSIVNRALVQPVGISIEHLGAILVEVPPNEDVTVARTGRSTDLIAVGDTEVHSLRLGAPVERGIRFGVRMQEHAVLDLTPLGIYRHATDGQGAVEVELGCARLVHVPALEHITGFGAIECRACICIEVRTIGDVFHSTQRMGFLVLQGVVVAIRIDAIHEVDGVAQAIVVVINFPIIANPFPADFVHAGI